MSNIPEYDFILALAILALSLRFHEILKCHHRLTVKGPVEFQDFLRIYFLEDVCEGGGRDKK